MVLWGGKLLILIKIDKQGSITWLKEFGGASSDLGSVDGYDVIQTVDGGYVIVGITTGFNKGGPSGLLLIKTDQNGMIAPEAGFAIFSGGIACDSFTIRFETANVISLIDTLYWFFGDSSTAIGFNPTHTYTQPGTYTASLIVANPLGRDTMIRKDYIRVFDTQTYPKAVANFIADDTVVSLPNAIVNFVILGTGQYFFVDVGDTSIWWVYDVSKDTPVVAPGDTITHTYTSVGTYTVELQA